jgi:hypothetical protein
MLLFSPKPDSIGQIMSTAFICFVAKMQSFQDDQEIFKTSKEFSYPIIVLHQANKT